MSAADDGKQFRREAINAHDHVNSAVATLTVATPRGHLDVLAGRIGGAANVNATGSDARMSGWVWPSVDATGNVYFGSFAQLRRADASGHVSSFAGDDVSQLGGTFVDATTGSGGAVNMGMVTGTAVAPDGTVYSADAVFNTIRRTRPDGSTSLFAGFPDQSGGSADGTGATARFEHPQGIALDASGNLFVADMDNHTIRKITPDGVVTTLAGKAGVHGSTGTTAADALFNRPQGVAVDARGVVYVTDTGNATVRTITPVGNVNVLAGSSGPRDWTTAWARLPASRFRLASRWMAAALSMSVTKAASAPSPATGASKRWPARRERPRPARSGGSRASRWRRRRPRRFVQLYPAESG